MQTCKNCELRPQCTRAKGGVARTVKRHYNQEAIDEARIESHSQAAKRDRIRRRWLMEGSFGDAAQRHGFKRSRWRRLWRQRIQDYIIATVQNLRLLAKKSYSPRVAVANSVVCESTMPRLVSYNCIEMTYYRVCHFLGACFC